jgi:hypothetical protein
MGQSSSTSAHETVGSGSSGLRMAPSYSEVHGPLRTAR